MNSSDDINSVQIAVNGTLMRGLELNINLLKVNAKFVREDRTDPNYRLWSINDRHPGMLCSKDEGKEIDLEVWELSAEGLVTILNEEPPGLCVGRITLSNGQSILGVLAEPYLVEGQKEITSLQGWRAYIAEKGNS